MKDSVQRKLDDTIERFEEIGHLLSTPEVIGDQNRFRDLSREYARLEPVVQCYQDWQAVKSDRDEARAMLDESDPEMQALGKAELSSSTSALENLEAELQKHLLPRDPRDDASVYLEVRAGTGGDEAALFSGDLFNMYRRYAETQGWQVETVSTSDGDVGGYKEIIARIIGNGVFSRLKFESGAHRVQRVPETESQGRVHTSACTVAILAEAEEIEEVDISPADLRIDTFRASGAGGQHVNKTDSAIRLTHIPSGLVVECQEERSQHKNRAKAMSLLKARLFDAEQEKRQAEEAEDRKSQVGSGDRSERIRTYNFPQGRVTDHRINLTLYKLDQILAGEVDMVIDPLLQEHQAAQLAQLGNAG